MFFLFTFFVGLIALVFGLGLLMWSYRNNGKCVVVGRVFGYVVTLAAIVGLVATLFCGVMYKKGKYHKMYQLKKAQAELVQPQHHAQTAKHNNYVVRS